MYRTPATVPDEDQKLLDEARAEWRHACADARWWRPKNLFRRSPPPAIPPAMAAAEWATVTRSSAAWDGPQRVTLYDQLPWFIQVCIWIASLIWLFFGT